MDFDGLVADHTKIMTKHFTSGRGGHSVEFVGVHYMDADGDWQDCYNWWQSREASAHYAVDSSGTVGQLVWDRDTAWALGNFSANQRSINIEHANRGRTITDACLDAGAHLVAAICKRYGLGRPEWYVNVFPHKYFSPTTCPGPLLDVYGDRYIRLAQEYYDAMTGASREEQDMTDAQAQMLQRIHDEVKRTDDCTGRERGMLDHDKLNWLGANQADMRERIDAMDKKIDSIIEALSK